MGGYRHKAGQYAISRIYCTQSTKFVMLCNINGFSDQKKEISILFDITDCPALCR